MAEALREALRAANGAALQAYEYEELKKFAVEKYKVQKLTLHPGTVQVHGDFEIKSSGELR